MMKCCIVDTSYPVNTRNEKIKDSLLKSFPNMELSFITWDRNNTVQSSHVQNYYLYKGNVKLGDRIKKFFYLFGFKRFVGEILEKEKPSLIIASHWDALFVLPDRLDNVCVVYDNLDIPDGSFFAIKLGTLLERLSLHKADIITHASRFFVKLFNKCSQPQLVLENKPLFDNIETKDEVGNPYVISFIGTIRYFDTLSKLVDAIKEDSRYELHFYGDGPDFNVLSEYCKNINNIKLFGKYDYSEIRELYRCSDLIWAVYPNKDYNVKYAISNKFYESMYLGVPCVYANKTELGDFVENNNIGYVVDPYDVVAIRELLQTISSNRNFYNQVKMNIHGFAKKETSWNEDFQKLVQVIIDIQNPR